MSVLAVNQDITVNGKPFHVVELLGEGLTAEVYRATMTDTGRPVALKVLKPGLSPEFRQSFMDEPTTLSLLRSEESRAGDNLSAIPEVILRPDDQSEQRILVMELIEGPSVLDLLEKRDSLPEKTALAIADQVLRVLHLLHTGLRKSYTDFQLRNIRWQEDKGLVKLIDWNHVSKPFPETPPDGDETDAPLPGVVADLVRMGAFLYQMLTGKGAFQTGETAGTLAARAGDQWTADVSAGTRFLVERALHPNPAYRFPSAAAFRAAVREQIALWHSDRDELDDDTTAALREIRNEGRRREPALLQRAVILVDVFDRLFPSPRTTQWREEIAAYIDQVSPAWGVGRGYYRAELYSKAVELWAGEAPLWQQPGLWRWLALARQAAEDPAAFAQEREAFEAVLELMDGEHWAEVAARLKPLRRGPADDLAREATAHQMVAAAEANEQALPPRTEEAARNYRQAAQVLAAMRDKEYRATLQSVYGWNDLEERAQKAERRGQQLAGDARAVEALRALPKTSNELVGGITAALRANPANPALVDFAAERAADKTLEPERRHDIALAALAYGNLSKAMRQKLETQRDDARRIIEQRLKDAREAEEEARRRQQRAEAAARREREREEALERQRQEDLASDENARRDAQLQQAEQRRQADLRRQLDKTQLTTALTNREWAAVAFLLPQVGKDDIPPDLPGRTQTAFDVALATGRQDDARALASVLDRLEPDKRREREQRIDRIGVNRDELWNLLHATQAAAAVAVADLTLEPPNYERAAAAYSQADNHRQELNKRTKDARWAGVLPNDVVAELNRDLERLDGAIQRRSLSWPERMKLWARRYWPLALVALLLFGGGVLLGFVIDDGGGGDPTPTPVAELTPQTTPEGGVLNVTDTPTPSPTPEPPTPEPPTAEPPTAEPPTPEPTATSTPPPLPSIDLAAAGLSPTVGGTPDTYHDMPDLSLDVSAAAGAAFDWSGENLRLTDETGAVWTVYLASLTPEGQTLSKEPVRSIFVVSNDAPPAPDNSGAAIRLEWARDPASSPLPPGTHDFAFLLENATSQTRPVNDTLRPFTVPPPLALTVFAKQTYRQLPVWDPKCNVSRAAEDAELQVEALAWANKPKTESDTENKGFFLIRLPGTRQTYWLPNWAARQPEALITALPPVTPPEDDVCPAIAAPAAPAPTPTP